MTEDDCPRVSSPESMPSIDSSLTKQRKKRKWDQPAELLVSAGVAIPGVLPLGNMGSLTGIALPGVVPAAGASLMNPISSSYGTLQQMFLVPSMQQHAAALVQKNSTKDTRGFDSTEIVINDAESAVRYKLTKRQTQEEIQKCTGSVVITRGKYRPPDTPLDGDKPLYLHISAGAHLETTAERIKAVDQAAAMVEEMLKQGSANNGVKVPSTCVFLGFEPDPSLNITARIRGPNDQYVNHIMNETGATVLLRGRGSGYSESASSEVQQPLHLLLSSSNPKSLEHAKLLAENLLDTICTECGASRISSCKVYGAVPPPLQLLSGVQSSWNELKDNNAPSTSSTSSTSSLFPAPAVSSVVSPGITTSPSQGKHQPSQPHIVCYPQPPLTGGTSYNGYGGIYPQATPLQQVALALRQSTSPVTSTISPAINPASRTSTSNTSLSSEKERRPPQKRKFQELPVTSEGPAKRQQDFSQDSGFLKPQESAPMSKRNMSSMPAPKKLVQSSSNGTPLAPPQAMLPPPSRTMLPPPPISNSSTTPPPKFNSLNPLPLPKFNPSTLLPSSKFNSSAPVQKVNTNKIGKISEPKIVPDTLISLMEYGDEDDDLEETAEEILTSHSSVSQAAKPFWAV